MTTITINDRSKSAKCLIEYLKTLSYVTILDKKKASKISKETFLAEFKQSLIECKEKNKSFR